MHPRNRNCAARAVAAAPTLMMPAAASRIGLAVAAALATCAVAPPAHADDAAAAADVAPGGLQEVVVTARKRSENLQDVPLSIDVLTQKDVQNLGIVQFEDYATKVPSISFISIGPGTQTFFMRGVSDGSNPNYANTSATGFFLDDSSLSWFGVEPDLHLYDIERIEVLNGPQGTTFGASSMAGAIRYITNKPDVNAFSGGADFDGGKIQDGQENWTYEGFVNIPLIEGTLGFRASAFSASNGGFITNQLTTRTWVNGTVSNNAEWARDGYNREHQEGMRAALKWVLNDKWSALFSYDYQRMSSDGAWDEDPTLAPDTVERFGPQALSNQDKIAQFHLDGDVGIADLVFASTYWSLPTRRWDEYSQYMQNYNAGASSGTGYPGTQEGFTCQNDPFYGGTPFTGCKVPLQYYEYHTNPERWSDELRLVSKPGGRFHWLVGTYWEKTRDKNSGSTYFMPGLQTNGAAFQYENAYYGTTGSSLPPGQWYSYTTRSDYLQTTEFANISYDITSKLNVEAGEVHFHSDFKYYSPYGQFAYNPVTASLQEGSSHKWDGKLGIELQGQRYGDGVRRLGAGIPRRRREFRRSTVCYAKGVPQQYIPDTLNNYELGWKTTWLENRLLWNGATYLMDWKNLQTLIYDVNICPSSSFNANVGASAHLRRRVERRLQGGRALVAAGVHQLHRLAPDLESVRHFRAERGRAAAVRAVLQLERQPALRAPAERPAERLLAVGHRAQGGHVGRPARRRLERLPAHAAARIQHHEPAARHESREPVQWLTEFYITNLTDKNAIIYTNTGNFDLRQTTNEPRTFGVRLSYRFGKQSL